MLRLLFFSLCVFFVSPVFSQENTQTDSIQLFYNINETESAYNNNRLDSMLALLKTPNLKIKITGYADFLHNTMYNLALSQRRAQAVKDYILSRTQSVSIVSCKGLGEKFSRETTSKDGEPFQRRVTVVFESVPEIKKENPAVAVKEEKIKEEKDNGEEKNKFENLDKGQSLAVEGLHFEPGRHFITKASVPVLQKLLTTLQNNPKLKIQIQGHVCCTYGQDDGLDYDTHERKLSENRARAIYDYLISKGISSKRLSYKGFGHSKPLYPAEATPEEEQANRRVEILIVEK